MQKGNNGIPKAIHFRNLGAEITSFFLYCLRLPGLEEALSGARGLLHNSQQVASSHFLPFLLSLKYLLVDPWRK